MTNKRIIKQEIRTRNIHGSDITNTICDYIITYHTEDGGIFEVGVLAKRVDRGLTVAGMCDLDGDSAT